jgi:hypothetical protein
MEVKNQSFKRLDDPIGNGKAKKYVFYVKIDDVAIDIPMATNPRDQKLNSSVASDIEASLTSNDGYFHLKNRGIVISAAKVHFNNKANVVELYFDEDSSHGNIDGGHTYKIVQNHIGDHLDQFVQFEVMTGVEDIIEQLAEARNNSVQVDEKSMAELRKQFEPIKEGIEGMPFYHRIAFKQNQVATDNANGKNLKMIDAREVVAIIGMFNTKAYSAGNQPIQAYSSKKKMLENYLTDSEFFRSFTNVAPDIFDLYEIIETQFAEAYNTAGGRYGRKKYSGYKEKDGKIQVIGKSKFGMENLYYKVPDGLIYPVVAAFRSLLEYDDKTMKYAWIKDPFDTWEKLKENIVYKVMSFASSIGDNPNAVGKDANIWDLAYMTIQLSTQK